MLFKVFKVFQCVSGFSLSSDEGPLLRPFHSLALVKGGVAFFNFQSKIVFGDPLASNSDPPLGGKVCLQKHPK